MGVDELMRKLYTAPTQQTKEHFLHVNAHVVNGHARRGQLVVVTPADPDRCSELEYAFAEMVRHVDAVSRFEGGESAPEIVNRFYDVLSFVDDQAAGGFVGAYGMCTVVFALPTGGTSLIWCGILAGGVGAFVGGWVGSVGGKAIGEIVYENIYQTAR